MVFSRNLRKSCFIVDFGSTYTLVPYQKPVRSRAILWCTHPNAKCIIARLFKTCTDNYGIYYKGPETHKSPEELQINRKPARNVMESRTGGHS